MKKKQKKNMAILSGVTLGLLTLVGAGCTNDSDDIKKPVEVVPVKAPLKQENPTIPVPSAATSSDKSGTVPTKTTVSTTKAVPVESAKKSTYKDGTYTVKTEYKSPEGLEPMGVTVVLANDIITSTNFDVLATVPISKKLQEAFSSSYKSVVVGKNLDAANVGIVAGASLTSGGFNDALAKIKAQAK